MKQIYLWCCGTLNKNSICSVLNLPRETGDRSIRCLPNLHADDGVDEEEHGDEQADVRQSLEGLNEGPQENPDGVTLAEQFDETSCSEQLQETHVERINELGRGGKLLFTGGAEG